MRMHSNRRDHILWREHIMIRDHIRMGEHILRRTHSNKRTQSDKRTHSDKRTRPDRREHIVKCEHIPTREHILTREQLDIKALSLISLPMDHAKSILLKQISRPLINYTGTACQYFARPACMFQAVPCNCSLKRLMNWTKRLHVWWTEINVCRLMNWTKRLTTNELN